MGFGISTLSGSAGWGGSNGQWIENIRMVLCDDMAGDTLGSTHLDHSDPDLFDLTTGGAVWSVEFTREAAAVLRAANPAHLDEPEVVAEVLAVLDTAIAEGVGIEIG
jgi:hypothetical protein